MFPADSKKFFRQQYRHLRHQISPEQQTAASQLITQCYLKNFIGHQKNIAVYLACDGEINLHFLIEQLWQLECAVFLPVIHPDTQTLSFVRYFKSSVMKKNQYGIDEPEMISQTITPEALDIVLMPVVAFDSNGVRLGMGKGYYDHCFSFCRYPHNQPLLVGVAHQCQQAETLPADEWDVPLDGVMTEKKLFLFNEGL